jgi:hypothetical protein
MLRRDEFIQYWKNRDRADQGWRGLLLGTTYIGGMLLFAIPLKFKSFNNQPLLTLIWVATFFGYLIVMPRVWIRLFSGVFRNEFHHCPVCQKLLREQNRLVVVTTNRCGYCGETILTD